MILWTIRVPARWTVTGLEPQSLNHSWLNWGWDSVVCSGLSDVILAYYLSDIAKQSLVVKELI